MRHLPLLLPALLLAPLLLPTAAATHLPHGPCGFSTLSVGDRARLDVWTGGCVGATVNVLGFSCLPPGQHVHAAGLHVILFFGAICETGALLELP